MSVASQARRKGMVTVCFSTRAISARYARKNLKKPTISSPVPNAGRPITAHAGSRRAAAILRRITARPGSGNDRRNPPALRRRPLRGRRPGHPALHRSRALSTVRPAVRKTSNTQNSVPAAESLFPLPTGGPNHPRRLLFMAPHRLRQAVILRLPMDMANTLPSICPLSIRTAASRRTKRSRVNQPPTLSPSSVPIPPITCPGFPKCRGPVPASRGTGRRFSSRPTGCCTERTTSSAVFCSCSR